MFSDVLLHVDTKEFVDQPNYKLSARERKRERHRDRETETEREKSVLSEHVDDHYYDDDDNDPAMHTGRHILIYIYIYIYILK